MPRVIKDDRDRLNDAARAAWLYYIAGNTQDEIAQKMDVSRQSAQRLVALATRERLVKFRLDHPIRKCLELATGLRKRYGLEFCEVTPTDVASDDPALGVAEVAAAEMERYLKGESPIIFAVGTGREICAAAFRMSPVPAPQHKIVSLVGSLALDGSADVNDPLTRIGELTGAPFHPLPVQLIASSKEERDVICAQRPIRRNMKLAQSANIAFVSVDELEESSPLLNGGFISHEDLTDLRHAGAAGEIIGWVFDDDGTLIPGLTNDRVASVPLSQPSAFSMVGVARGANKLRAIRAALKGHWVNGLITDESTADALLS